MRRRLPALLLAFVPTLPLAAQGASEPVHQADPPRLVVLITVDQMRADYLDRFGTQFTGGLGRLIRGGAWFTDAHHDHAITETAPGHATLLTGRFPRSTGIMMNRIGVEDRDTPLLDGAFGTGASPKRLKGSTLVDWLHEADGRSQALSVSMKDRAAILPAGRSRAQVWWYSPDGRFTTSTWYRATSPDWVKSFNERHLAQSYAGRAWSLLLPDSAYHEPDSVAIESNGRAVLFPHTLPEDPVDAADVIRGTPFMDELVLAFALHGVQSLKLGGGPQTDVLSVSLSATDVIGHSYGPDSREIHDQLLRVDRALGTFIDSLYRLRDSSRIVIAFTGDHGVGSIPEIAPANVQPRPVRVSLGPLFDSLRAELKAAKVNPDAIDSDGQIFIANRDAFRTASVNADSVLDALAARVRRVPGVARVDRFRRLLADTSTDAIARRWAHQFPATVPIDLIVTLTPLSIWGGNVATHGSPYDYDTHVPLIFYGAGVKPGKYTDFVRTVDLAPTLAEFAHVRPTEQIDGVVLRKAIR